MSSAKNRDEEEAKLGVMPIRANEALYTAAFIFLLEARRFAPSLISDTDHN